MYFLNIKISVIDKDRDSMGDNLDIYTAGSDNKYADSKTSAKRCWSCCKPFKQFLPYYNNN